MAAPTAWVGGLADAGQAYAATTLKTVVFWHSDVRPHAKHDRTAGHWSGGKDATPFRWGRPHLDVAPHALVGFEQDYWYWYWYWHQY